MKIIKTANYKILESAWEGQAYGPDNEDEWIDTIKEKPTTPTVNRIQPRNRNRARFRPSGLDAAPVSVLPSAQQNEIQRNQMFDSNLEEEKQKTENEIKKEKQYQEDIQQKIYYKNIVHDWLSKLPINDGTEHLGKFYHRWASTKNNKYLGPLRMLYLASLGETKAIEWLSAQTRIKDLGEKIQNTSSIFSDYPDYLKHIDRTKGKK